MSDLIRRADAIKALYKYRFVSKDVIEREIKAIPSADRPQGEWIMSKPEEEGFGAVFKCSRCSCEVDCVPTNFCPTCGADMRKESE